MKGDVTARELRRRKRRIAWLAIQSRYYLWPILLGGLIVWGARTLSIAMGLYFGDSLAAATGKANVMSVFFFTLFITSIALQAKSRRTTWPVTNSLIHEVYLALNQAQPEHLGILCEIHASCGSQLNERAQARLDARITQQLLASEASEVPLSQQAEHWLKKQAICGKNPMLRVAALIALKERKIAGVQELALSASHSDDDRVRAAARDVLTTLRGVQ